MEYLSLWMFAAAVVLLLVGYPVAFTLGGTAVLFTLIGSDMLGWLPWEPMFRLARLNILPQRIYGTIMENYTLVAVPFFVFMGVMLEKSGLAEKLLETMAMLFGPLRGGLAISVVVVGTLLAASTGVVGASVVTMAILALPVMLRYGYSQSLSTGVIATSGTLGQIIPPSIVLVILGDQVGVSIGTLFLGAVVPGILLSLLMVGWVALVAWRRPREAPALPPEARTLRGFALGREVLRSLVPPLFLILVVLGTIFFGIATPTEAGAMGALGAMVLAAFNRRLSPAALIDSLDQTVKLTSMVFIILVGATAFSMVFTALRGDQLVDSFLVNLPGGQWGFLFFTMLVIFLLGFFIDFIEISFIVVPLVAPIAARFFGADMLPWFAVLVAMNLQTSFLTPPFGFSLFYLKGVAPPEVKTRAIYRGVIPFIAIQMSVVLLIVLFPQLVTWLPNLSAAN